MKKILFMLMALALTFAAASCSMDSGSEDDPADTGTTTVAVTGVTVAETSSVVVGATVTLKATVAPADATEKKVTWSSSSKDVATVTDAGVVTGVSAGSTVITVKSVSDSTKVDTCTVTVTAAPEVPPTFDPSTVSYLFAVSATPTITASTDSWSSGTAIDTAYATDATYNPCISLASGTGWGPTTSAAAIAFKDFGDGKLAEYTNLVFKVKMTGFSVTDKIRVKVPEVEVACNLSEGTALADGWVQMNVPLSSFPDVVAAAKEFAILQFGTGTILVADVGLYGTPASVDNSGLTAAITSATALNAAHAVGTADGNVTDTAKNTYTAAIAAAQAVVDNAASTQPEITAALTALKAATAAFNGAILVLAPTTVPASPTLASSAVISLYNSSATYTNITGINWNPGWGPLGSIGDVTIDSKTIKCLNLVNFLGVDFDGNKQNITGKTKLHFSYWTANATTFSVYIIYTGGEKQLITPTLSQNSWAEFDIECSSAADLTTIRQLKFTGAKSVGGAETEGACVVYFDNVYFH